MCASKARQQYTPMGLFFFIYSYQNKTSYNKSIHEKVKFFCVTSLQVENESEYANELYTNQI